MQDRNISNGGIYMKYFIRNSPGWAFIPVGSDSFFVKAKQVKTFCCVISVTLREKNKKTRLLSVPHNDGEEAIKLWLPEQNG